MSLKRRLSQPGIVVSTLVHVGALVATLVAFSDSPKFDDQQETVPVEIVTDNQFNQIMKGDKSAKQVRPDAPAQQEQTASLPEPAPAPPPTPVQKVAPPPPPPPPPPLPPQRQVEEPPPPLPPVAPPRPATPPPEPPPPTPPIREVEAEPVLPKPVPKPPPKPTPPVPTPPVVPHPVVAKVHETRPPPPPKPRPVEKPKVDQLAKLMEQQQNTPDPAPPSPRPAPPAPPAHTKPLIDLTDISRLLQGHDAAPAPRSATPHDLSRVASLGSPTASAPKMSPSFWAGLDGLLEDQYRGCWSYLGLTPGVKYIPQVRVVYAQDGSLQGQPVLINPPADPSLQSLADSALRAVRRCNPLRIPEQYAPYYEQWKGRVLRFDPEEMAG